MLPMSGSSRRQRRVGVAYVPFVHCLLTMLMVFAAIVPARADQPNQESAIPGFAELQDAGALVGEIRVIVDDIFDLNDPKEDNALFRLANKLHFRTRTAVIRRMVQNRSRKWRATD